MFKLSDNIEDVHISSSNDRYDLSIITATRLRHSQLAQRIMSVKEQVCDINIQHIIVVDGSDDVGSINVCKYYGSDFIIVGNSAGNCGALAKDIGLESATGSYVTNWDDDDIYYRHAAQSLFDAANGYDIGLCNVNHFMPLSGENGWRQLLPADVPEFGKWSQMCAAVKLDLAKSVKMNTSGGRGTDWRWYLQLIKYNPRINKIDTVIGDIVVD